MRTKSMIHTTTQSKNVETATTAATLATPQAITNIQVGSLNGRDFTYSPDMQSQESQIVPLQQLSTALPQDPPPYSANIEPAHSTSRSMYETNVITGDVSLANLSPENIKRRNFFFLLKDRLTEYISSSPCITCCDSSYDNTGLADCNQTNCPPCFVWMAPPPCGTSESEGVRQFATRLALGLTYIYQDIIPLLDPDSNKRLPDYFVHLIDSCFFDGRDCCAGMRTVSVYSILMNSLNRYLPERQNCNVKNLKTVDGFEFSFNHLLSLDVLTIDRGLYEATNARNMQLSQELKNQGKFRVYRWGTSDAIKIDLLLEHDPNKIHLRKVEGSVSNHVSLFAEVALAKTYRGTWRDFLPNALISASTEFWNRADGLANSYLSQDEFRSYTQLIPAGSRSVYLLKEVDMTDNGGGSGG